MFSKSTIKYIQSLQHKKFRDEYGVFVAEGPKLVAELLQSKNFACKAVYAVADWLTMIDKRTEAAADGMIEIIRDFELEKIAHYTTANKVVAVFGKKNNDVNFSVKNKITLVLDDIQDPGNLGTIIRTADWFGIENIICSVHTADMYNPKVVQSTMASLGRVNLLYTNIEEWLINTRGIKKYAAVLGGVTISKSNKTEEGIIIIGNESKGISPAILALADEQITIPKTGDAESLNAAVATGIILYAFCS